MGFAIFRAVDPRLGSVDLVSLSEVSFSFVKTIIHFLFMVMIISFT